MVIRITTNVESSVPCAIVNISRKCHKSLATFQDILQTTKQTNQFTRNISLLPEARGLGGVAECSHSISEVAGSNLSLGGSCLKVGSYLQMPDGVECRVLTNTGSSSHKLAVVI